MVSPAVPAPPPEKVEAENDLRIFMSYRRSDDANFTGRMHDKLISVFGESNVFRDIDSIPAGSNFADVIRRRLEQVDVVVALIGPSWSGRLETPTDFVRMEIVHALVTKKPVVPVLIEETTLPDRATLPEELRSLLEINAVRVRRDPDFHRDAARVIAGVREAASRAREVLQVERRAAEERERIEADAKRLASEQRAAEQRAEEAGRRRELADELAEAEADEAERRRAAAALERERLERLVELSRLEDEATRRQIADERARLTTIEEAKRRRDEEVLAAEARTKHLRELLAHPPQLPPRSDDDEIVKPLELRASPPPVVSPGPREFDTPKKDVEAASASEDGRPRSDSTVNEASPSKRADAAAVSNYRIGVVLLVCSTALGIWALSIDSGNSGYALDGNMIDDLVAFILTLGLLAPVLARRVRLDPAAVTAGVGFGYVVYQGIPQIGWFYGGDFRWDTAGLKYPTVIAAVGALLGAGWYAMRRSTLRQTQFVHDRRFSRLLQIGSALGVVAGLIILAHRVSIVFEIWATFWVSEGAPVLVITALAASRKRSSALTLIAILVTFIVHLAAAYLGGPTLRPIVQLVTALLAAAIAVWRLNLSEQDPTRDAPATSFSPTTGLYG